ncbi:MAG: glycosyltransferase [Pirellula sp.]
MRIDLVITELDMGGAEKCCTELAIDLKQRGNDVRVIAFGPRPMPPRDQLAKLLVIHSVETHFLGATGSWMLPSVMWGFRKLLKTNSPDLVQSFLWHANVLSAAIVPSFQIPLVGGVRVAEPKKSRHAIGGWAAKRMNRIVCVSQSVADWSIRREGVEPQKIVVIPNGVQLHVPETSFVSPLPNAVRILLFVGRLEPQKGIDILIEHAPDLLSKLPEHHLVILGDGAWRDAVSQLALRSDVQNRVHWLGQRDDVRDWMRRSELLILPTRYEGMPNVILEAMAERLAVVTTRVEGIDELLADALADQAVAPGDWTTFFERARMLALDAQVRRKFGEANRLRVEQQFSLSQQLAKYHTLYEGLLRGS